MSVKSIEVPVVMTAALASLVAGIAVGRRLYGARRVNRGGRI